MPDTSTRNTVLNTVATTLGIDRSAIADSQTLADLGADSLEGIEISMQIEDTLDLLDPIPGETMETATIGELIAKVDMMRGEA